MLIYSCGSETTPVRLEGALLRPMFAKHRAHEHSGNFILPEHEGLRPSCHLQVSARGSTATQLSVSAFPLKRAGSCPSLPQEVAQ